MTDASSHTLLTQTLLTRLDALRAAPELLAALLIDLRGTEHGDDPQFAQTLDHYLESWLGAQKHELFPVPGQRRLILAPAEAAPLLKAGANALLRVLHSHGFGTLRVALYDLATEAERMAADILPPEPADRATLRAATARVPTAAFAQLLEVERVLHGADLDSLVREQPVWSFADPDGPVVTRTELVVALDELEIRLDLPLRRDDWLRHEVCARLDHGLLRHLARDRARDPRPFAVDLHTGTVLDDGAAALLHAIPVEARGRLTAELACWEVGLSPARFAATAERLTDLGVAVAVDHVPLPALSVLALGGVEPAYVKALWAPRQPDAGELLAAAVQRFGPERLVLWRCDEPAALETGRAAGVTLFQGRAADAAARSGLEPADAAPRRDAGRTGGVDDADGGEDESTPPAETPPPRPGLFDRLFGRG